MPSAPPWRAAACVVSLLLAVPLVDLTGAQSTGAPCLKDSDCLVQSPNDPQRFICNTDKKQCVERNGGSVGKPGGATGSKGVSGTGSVTDPLPDAVPGWTIALIVVGFLLVAALAVLGWLYYKRRWVFGPKMKPESLKEVVVTRTGKAPPQARPLFSTALPSAPLPRPPLAPASPPLSSDPRSPLSDEALSQNAHSLSPATSPTSPPAASMSAHRPMALPPRPPLPGPELPAPPLPPPLQQSDLLDAYFSIGPRLSFSSSTSSASTAPRNYPHYALTHGETEDRYINDARRNSMESRRSSSEGFPRPPSLPSGKSHRYSNYSEGSQDGSLGRRIVLNDGRVVMGIPVPKGAPPLRLPIADGTPPPQAPLVLTTFFDPESNAFFQRNEATGVVIKLNGPPR